MREELIEKIELIESILPTVSPKSRNRTYGDTCRVGYKIGGN